MKRLAVLLFLLWTFPRVSSGGEKDALNPPIYIAFLWHMHQPIYWPYETVLQTDQNARYSYSVQDIHNQRRGPYTSWPRTAVQKGITAGLGHFGAQVSFSGSLIENLNVLEGAGNGNFLNWKSHWNIAKTQLTALGNPRLDMVGFGYHHPLMGLIGYGDIRKQIQAHRQMMAAHFSGAYSRGIFPPENAFSPRMIPALVDEGMAWVMVDNVHFDRACQGYPFSTAGNVYEPNRADARNPNPGDWVALNGLWAPTQNSGRWGRQPRYVEYIDPSTGIPSRIIAVPTDRYLGNEDGRGGFGALNYEYVMSQLEPYNTDPAHPILIVLHHDGDNYGGGSEAYYNNNFQNFVNWLQADPSRFVCTTVEDYLEMFPPDPADVIHVEDGSWSGADNGDPEFKKWNGDPSGGYSPDRNSWGIITAGKNFVATAEQMDPVAPGTLNAWKYFLNGQASDYWYWDGSQNGIWDSHPARAANLAIPHAQAVIAGGTDLTPPTVYLPQREPYNPGATEWGINQPSDFTVWTYAFDVSGLRSVTLRYRTDLDGVNASSTTHNETYAGGSDVTAWADLPMTGAAVASQTDPQPLYKAKEYSAAVVGLNEVLVDYYVEAVDSNGNTARSPIMHVWVGQNNGGGATGVSWEPAAPAADDSITIIVTGATQGAKLHWGVNNTGSAWQTPHSTYWPAGTVLFGGTGPAVETPFAGPDTGGVLRITMGPFNSPAQGVERVAFVIHYDDNSWNNNNGQDFHVTISGGSAPQGYLMDGIVDTSAVIAATNGPLTLHLGWNGVQLYAATQSAQSQGSDMFILIADSQRALVPAMWAKSGSVAAWGAFLGNESTNNWNGWFNSTGSGATGNGVNAAGSILEGALNIPATFGRVPPVLYVAVGKYATADGGALQAQVPAGNGDGNIDAVDFFVFAVDSVLSAPAPPVLLAPPDGATIAVDSVLLVWRRAAPAVTGYRLDLAVDSLFTTPLVDSTLVDTTARVSGLSPDRRYWWRVQARNAAGWGVPGAPRRFTVLPDRVGRTVPFTPSWNMLSNPVTTPDDSVLELFPVSLLPYGFAFDPATGYGVSGRLAAGRGYWLKFEAAGTALLSGWERTADTVAVSAGWNMIGSVSGAVPVAGVTTDPPGIIVSDFFRYDGGGYAASASIEPGGAYWVKVSTAGVMCLGAGASGAPLPARSPSGR